MCGVLTISRYIVAKKGIGPIHTFVNLKFTGLCNHNRILFYFKEMSSWTAWTMHLGIIMMFLDFQNIITKLQTSIRVGLKPNFMSSFVIHRVLYFFKYAFSSCWYIWSKILSLSLYAMLKLSKTTPLKKIIRLWFICLIVFFFKNIYLINLCKL